MSLNDAELTPAEIRIAEAILERALAPRALPAYSPDERLVLAILAANLTRQQRIRGKKVRALRSCRPKTAEITSICYCAMWLIRNAATLRTASKRS